MVDAEAFRKAMEFEIEAKVRKPTLTMKKNIIKYTYEAIFELWPNDTYWSASNHRISITGRPVFRLEPRKRPDKRGALINKSISVKSSELAKLKGLNTKNSKPGRSIIIGNSVPYAVDVQFEPGRGEQLYSFAASMGVARAQGVSNVIGASG